MSEPQEVTVKLFLKEYHICRAAMCAKNTKEDKLNAFERLCYVYVALPSGAEDLELAVNTMTALNTEIGMRIGMEAVTKLEQALDKLPVFAWVENEAEPEAIDLEQFAYSAEEMEKAEEIWDGHSVKERYDILVDNGAEKDDAEFMSTESFHTIDIEWQEYFVPAN